MVKQIITALIAVISFSSISSPLEAARKKHKLIYKNTTHTATYKRKSPKPHFAIKVTPPKKFGKNQFIFVEIYNYTKKHIAQIDFDIYFSNNSWYEYNSHINGGDILPGRSALRKVAVGQHKGKKAFPNIKKITLQTIKIYDHDANELFHTIYVDLVRNKKT